jgi:membrane peptidoglycan carboxypeptidase
MPRIRFPHRALLLKILGGIALALIVIAVVPPLRKGAALGLSKAIVFVASPLAPNIADFKQLPQTTKIVAVDGSTIAELDKSERRVPVTIDALPDHVKQAVMAAEDQDFYSHDGVDSTAIFRAFLRTAQGRTQGGSTITQQLAKINYTARERTAARKLKEVLYATKLEKKYSKDELLERYLNQVYFGDQAYGINAAAEVYFATTADKLTPDQAALIAGKIRAPEALDPRDPKDLKATKNRRDQVLRNMGDEGWLKPDELKAALAAPVELPPRPPADNDGLGKAPHFSTYVKREARGIEALGSSVETRENQLYTGGYTIETTFDPKVFDATVASVFGRLGAPEDPTTAVATVVPGDGAVRSLFGGLDFAATQQDMAGHPSAGRQIGSSTKPFVYLAALRKGIDPRTTYDGSSGRVIPCYRPEPVNNYAGEDLGGAITVDDALIHSVNVVFAELGCAAGPRDVKRVANDLGIPADASADVGGYLLGGFGGDGSKGANALEMASAYATFAAKGIYAKPYSIAKIKDRTGKVIYEAKPSTKPVFKPEEVGVLNNPLQGVIKSGTGRAAALGRPVAGKTGTTQDNIDAWFIGYTPQLATGVWVGFENKTERKSMVNIHGVKGVTGGSFPAQIFADVMKAALQGVKVEPLFTASPDQLDLQQATTTTASTLPTTTAPTTSTTAATGETTTTTAASGPTTTAPTATTARPPATTTTTAPTTTTTRKQQTTTTSSTSSTTSSTVQGQSSGSSTTTTAPP